MGVKPILFSTPMVQALLAGTKTQTRRTINPQPKLAQHHEPVRVEQRGERGWVWMVHTDRPAYQFATGDWKSRISVGDRLYVREHWRTTPGSDDLAPRDLIPHLMPVHYVADGGDMPWPTGIPGRFRQGMHMPRWASRLTLHVTEVRVQRLQEISASDCFAEGIPRPACLTDPKVPMLGSDMTLRQNTVSAYRALWESINGPGSWDANPWVAAYSFTVERGNIDELGRAA